MKKIIQVSMAVATVIGISIAVAADLQYNSDGTTFSLWSIGPDRINDQASHRYDPTNGLISRGDIVYPVSWFMASPTNEAEEVLFRARSNVSTIGGGLKRMHTDLNRYPTPKLNSPVLGGYYLTTPIAYVSDSGIRKTNYDMSTTTLEIKRQMRTVATALSNYFQGYNSYPPSKNFQSYQPLPNALTTPVAYLTSLPVDLYKPAQVLKYQRNFSSYIIWSVGKDGTNSVGSGFETSNQTAPQYVRYATGDIVYTNSDKFGESIWADPFEIQSKVDIWYRY